MLERLHLVTSLRCNNRCVFCMEGEHAREDLEETRRQRVFAGDFLTPEALEEQVKDACRLDTPILFTGGEPTINPHLIPMVELLRRKGFRRIALQTNGRMLAYPEFVLKLIQAGVRDFSISIHGSRPAAHDAMTRAPGSFQQTFQGLSNVMAFKRRWPAAGLRVTTHTTVAKINLADMEPLLRMLLSQPELDAVVLNPLVPKGNAIRYARQIMVSYSDVLGEFRRVLALLRSERAPRLSAISLTDIPLCVMPDLKDFLGSFERVLLVQSSGQVDDLGSRQGFPGGKRQECRKCVFTRHCIGVHSFYSRWRGWDEFVPLKTLPGAS